MSSSGSGWRKLRPGWQCGFNVVLPWPSILSPRFPIPDRKVTQQHPLVAFQPHSLSVSLSLFLSSIFLLHFISPYLTSSHLSAPHTRMYARTCTFRGCLFLESLLSLPSIFPESSQSRTHTRRCTNASGVLIVYATGTLNGIAEAWLLQFTAAVSESRRRFPFATETLFRYARRIRWYNISR